jgi:hypothetical protein
VIDLIRRMKDHETKMHASEVVEELRDLAD